MYIYRWKYGIFKRIRDNIYNKELGESQKIRKYLIVSTTAERNKVSRILQEIRLLKRKFSISSHYYVIYMFPMTSFNGIVITLKLLITLLLTGSFV